MTKPMSDWTDSAYARLGYVRDKMPPSDVVAVQEFLRAASPPQADAGGQVMAAGQEEPSQTPVSDDKGHPAPAAAPAPAQGGGEPELAQLRSYAGRQTGSTASQHTASVAAEPGAADALAVLVAALNAADQRRQECTAQQRPFTILGEAADTITRLQGELAEARALLKARLRRLVQYAKQIQVIRDAAERAGVGEDAENATEYMKAYVDYAEAAERKERKSREELEGTNKILKVYQDECRLANRTLAERDKELAWMRESEYVDFYEREFYPLSNFSAFKLFWGGYLFDTSEHAYHCEKFLGARIHTDTIKAARSAHDAFKYAEQHKAERRPDWDAIKVGIMRNILRAKASQHEYVLRKLLQTGNRQLIECSWRDDFWGWGEDRNGQNMLGKLWMEIRSELSTALAGRAGK